MASTRDISKALERFSQGKAKPADLEILQSALSAGQISVQQGVAIGGNATNSVIVTGDNNQIELRVELSAEAIQEITQGSRVKAAPPLRVLAVIAAPVAGLRDHEPAPASLSGRAEWASLRRAASVAPMHLLRLRPPTEKGIRDICSPNNAAKFNVVHFICHGLPGALALEDERGLTALVKAREIAGALKDGGVKLAVVNACYSAAGDEESIAQALVDAGIQAVVAHRWPLIDPAAVIFTQTLYRELAAGRTLRVAFEQAVHDTTHEYSEEKGNAVLVGDSALVFQLTGGIATAEVIEGSPLPDEAARFFGRGQQLLQLSDLLGYDSLRGVALTGIGGIGKSALAFETADRNSWRFPGGVAYIRAAEFGFKAEEALTDLSRQLVKDGRGDPLASLLTHVNSQPCLLIFDNMERAGAELDHLADFVTSLNLDSGTKTLFTLRPPLRDAFQDVREIHLTSGLDLKSAMEYARFVAGNEGAPREWQKAEEAHALANRVNGHPELIRLVIARSKRIAFSRVKQEYQTLSGRLDEALQEMIGRQVEAGGEQAKSALARLTIFPQPVILCEAAVAACGEFASGLDALVDYGVIALEQGDVQRYSLHPTALDWAKVHLQLPSNEIVLAKTQAASAYSEIADSNANRYEPFQSEHDNFMAALNWAWENEQWSKIGDLAQGMVSYLRMRGHWMEGHKWMERAVEARRKLPESDEVNSSLASHLDSLARFYADEGSLDKSLQLQNEAREIFEGLGDLKGKSATLHAMANVYVTRGDLNGAMKLYEQSLEIKEGLGDLKGKIRTLANMASVIQNSDSQRALSLYEEALGISQKLQEPFAVANVLSMMSAPLIETKENQKALECLTEAFNLFIQMQAKQEISSTVARLQNMRSTIGENEFDLLWKQITNSPLPDWLSQSPPPPQQGTTPEQFIASAIQAYLQRQPEAQKYYEACVKMAKDENASAELRALGHALQRILIGDKHPDLSSLPTEWSTLITNLLADS